LRINRPDKKNALTAAMYAAMTSALIAANEDASVRCLVLGGGPGAFTAGNDINDFLRVAVSGGGERPAMPFLHALARNEKPLVAAVQGVAVGIGTTLLFHCDRVIAGSDARFSTPFLSLGLLPEAASSLLAPRLMGYQRAFSLLVMGEPLSAEQARECGLVATVVAPDQVDAEALKIAQAIAALPPEGVAIARRLLRGTPDDALARIEEEARLFEGRLKSPEARAAFEAFLTRKR
jgi:enoyl-CoA hydratase/carnithine racemase